jgi:hypothetical protein
VNAGIFGNLNRAIKESRGEFVQVFSQDDVMLPGFLSSQHAMFSRHADIGLVYGLPNYIDEIGNVKRSSPDTTPDIIPFQTYVWIASHYGALPASISSIMVRREVFEVVGLFDERYKVAGDVEFYNRLAERFLIGYVKEVHHCVRGHAQATSALPSSGAKYLTEEIMLEEWFSKQWNNAEYEKVRYFRCSRRARWHVGWIRRLAATGRFREAFGALVKLHGYCPLDQVALAYVWRFLRVKGIDRPQLAPPANMKL